MSGPRALLRRAAVVAVGTTASAALGTVDISTVTVGNAGNAADTRVMNDGTSGYGQVNYAYSIGKFEVTAGQYTAFLNAVAASDAFGLYNPSMASDGAGCQILRSGTSGTYSYSVASDYANRPVNYVSWGDAARFANWLANGQPSGAQSAGTTETGSYTLNGAVTASSLMSVSRSNSATWVIGSENEWYKAAFYNPLTASYSLYATGSDALPSNDLLDPDAGNNANYLASQTDGTLAAPYYRTEVGAFENSASAYGTFDQNGNVWEWNESALLGTFRELRGGSFGTYDVTLAANFRYIDEPTYEDNTIGFRVASTVVLATPGDFNNDQARDARDIDLLFSAAQGSVPPALASFDVNADGVVNSTPNQSGSDADYWVRVLANTEYGDANLDQKVNFDDLLALAKHYNATTATWSEGDFNGVDGVTFDDLLLLAKNYNFDASAAAAGSAASADAAFASDWALAQSLVPEPTSLSLLMMSFAAMRRRRHAPAKTSHEGVRIARRRCCEPLESRCLLSGAALAKIYVIYNGTSDATIINPYASQGVSISAAGGAVTITNSSGISNLEYDLLGTSSAGSLNMSSTTPASFVLGNLNLTNASGPAINITGGQSHTFVAKAGTTNTLSDGSSNAKNGTLQTDGKITFSGTGALTLTGVKKHAVVTTSAIDVQSSSITVASALSDGLHSEGFTMSGGTITVASSGADGIDAGDAAVVIGGGTINVTSTAADVKAIKTGNGTITVTGGALNLNVAGNASKAVSAKGGISISAGTFGITLSGAAVLTASGSGFDPSYASAIKSDAAINVTGGNFTIQTTSAATGAKGFSAGGDLTISNGTFNLSTAAAGANYTNTAGVADSYSTSSFSSDASININGGTFTVTNSGKDGKGFFANANINVSGGTINITNSGASGKGFKADASVSFTGGNSTVNLSGATVLAATGSGSDPSYPVGVKSGGSIMVSAGSVTVAGTSTATGARGLSASAAINVTGGTISVNLAGNGATYTNSTGVLDSYSAAAFSSDTAIAITGGSVTTTSSGTGGKGLKSDGTLTIGSASGSPTLNITTTGARFLTSGTDYNHPKTIVATGAISIVNGTTTLTSTDDGIHSDTSITISGGTNKVTATSATSGVGEGVEAPIINFTGGVTNVAASNDGINATYGTVSGGTESNDNSQLNISGGILITAGSDAIDSNGNITVTGGTTIVCGPTNSPEEGIDFNGTFNMNGGLLISAGSNANMTKAMSATSTQVSMYLKSPTALASTSLLHIENAAGTEMVTFKPKNNVYYFHFSSPSLALNTQYKVYFGGTYTGGSYVGGSSGWGLLTGGTYAVTGASLRSTFTTSATAKVNTVTLSSAAAASLVLQTVPTRTRTSLASLLLG